YLKANPYNLVRVILGPRYPNDDEKENVYTRAATHFQNWIEQGLIAQDLVPAFYAYFQQFEVPDTGETAIRRGFIGLGQVEDYEKQIVFRHEKTLAGPKKDRRQILDHTGAHFGQIFMLYPDREAVIDHLLDQAAQGDPILDMVDEYETRHQLWPITD